jgi:5-formyltetrahydrofolate cyclo-ligase
MLACRAGMSLPVRAINDKLILENVMKLEPIQKNKRISCYISKGCEVETREIIKSLLATGKDVFVPIICGNEMVMSTITSIDDLIVGAFGISEPRNANETPISDIQVFIIPGIAFDRNLNRIGHGKGFYDAYLSKSEAVKIGLAYSRQLVDNIPKNDNDISMDLIVTEKGVLDGKRS